MNNTNDGGPAFPRNYDADGHNGMTLRDYFAAKAMQGLLSATRDDEVVNYSIMAPSAYRCADAMITARGDV